MWQQLTTVVDVMTDEENGDDSERKTGFVDELKVYGLDWNHLRLWRKTSIRHFLFQASTKRELKIYWAKNLFQIDENWGEGHSFRQICQNSRTICWKFVTTIGIFLQLSKILIFPAWLSPRQDIFVSIFDTPLFLFSQTPVFVKKNLCSFISKESSTIFVCLAEIPFNFLNCRQLNLIQSSFFWFFPIS